MIQLPPFVEELRREEESYKALLLVVEYLLMNGLSLEEVGEIPLPLLMDMVENWKSLLKMKGVMVKN